MIDCLLSVICLHSSRNCQHISKLNSHNLHSWRYFVIYRGADKSLARPTSRCRRTESIVSLEIRAILTETLGEHATSYATVKTWVTQFKRGDFSTFFSLVWLRTYQHPGNKLFLIRPFISCFSKFLFFTLFHYQVFCAFLIPLFVHKEGPKNYKIWPHKVKQGPLFRYRNFSCCLK
jgi:hypothetical protein